MTELEILHFNDVYNIEEKQGGDENNKIRAGAARFVSAFDQYNSKDKLVLFSGDLFFPSNRKFYLIFKLFSKHFLRRGADGVPLQPNERGCELFGKS